MQKEFIPYEEAKALKELGFDEPCLFHIKAGEINFYRSTQDHFTVNDKNGVGCSAILYQQAFRWFREKHNLKSYMLPIEYLDRTPETYQWNIFNKCHSGVEQLTCEEAELACLRKLIEIVKDGK